MIGHARTTLFIGAALAMLSGCAADPMTDSISAGVHAGPALVPPYAPDAENAPLVMNVARSTAANGDWAFAASLYRRAHAMDPENAAAARGLGEALSRLDAYEQAAEAFREALRIDPNDVGALRGLGNVLVVLGRPAVAVTHYERAMSIRPAAGIYNGLGVAHDMQDDYATAQAYYRAGLRMTPDDMALRNNLGLSLLLDGRIEESVAELKQVAGAEGATIRNRLNLALALVLAGSPESASSIARMDLGPRAARRQIAYFETIRALGNAPAARRAIQAHFRGAGDRHRAGGTAAPVGGMSSTR